MTFKTYIYISNYLLQKLKLLYWFPPLLSQLSSPLASRAAHSDWKLFWNQSHNMLIAFEVDWLIDWEISWKHWWICRRDWQSNCTNMHTHKTRMNHPKGGTRISNSKSQARAPKMKHTCLNIGRQLLLGVGLLIPANAIA